MEVNSVREIKQGAEKGSKWTKVFLLAVLLIKVPMQQI